MAGENGRGIFSLTAFSTGLRHTLSGIRCSSFLESVHGDWKEKHSGVWDLWARDKKIKNKITIILISGPQSDLRTYYLMLYSTNICIINHCCMKWFFLQQQLYLIFDVLFPTWCKAYTCTHIHINKAEALHFPKKEMIRTSHDIGFDPLIG